MAAYLIRGLHSENIKLKRSLALTVTLLIPFFPAFANVAMGIQQGFNNPSPLDTTGTSDPWLLLFHYAFELWTIFALPVIVAIISALLANTDHRTHAWKLLFSLSFPREAVFAAKWLALAGLVLLSNLVFALANLAGGIFIHITHPEFGLGFPLPLGEALRTSLISWLLSLLMISIHLWISLRWTSFLASITVGFAAMVSNLFLISSYLVKHVALSPWAMPSQVYGDWLPTLIASLAGSLLVCLLAGRGFVRRDVL